MKVVLDTNVLLAAFGTRGLCEALLEVCLESHEIVISDHILTELRKHLVGKFKMPTRQADEIVSFLRAHSTLVKPTKLSKNACRDSDDIPVLGTAVAGGAESLVTGDDDLLSLKHFQQISILSPRAFYDAII